MARSYWVALPGGSQPVRMDLEALLEAHRAHQLPAGTKVVAVGRHRAEPPPRHAGASAEPAAEPAAAETSALDVSGVDGWKLVEDVPELRANLESPVGGRVSLSAQGVVLGELHDGPLSMSGLSVGAEPPPPPAPRARQRQWSLPRWIVPLLIGLAPLAGIALLVGWLHGRYARGAVLEHLPDDCVRLDYVDLAAIDEHLVSRSDRAVRERALIQPGSTPDVEGDGSARAVILELLRHEGIRPYGTIAEAATCELARSEGPVSVVGGSFDARAVLGVLRDAFQLRDRKSPDQTYVLQTFENRPALRLSGERVAVAVGSHLIVIGPPRVVSQLLPAKSVARVYGIEREVLVRLTRRGASTTTAATFDDERFTVEGERMTVRHRWTSSTVGQDPAADMRERLVATARKIRGSGALAGLADALTHARVQSRVDEPNGVREIETEHTWELTDVRQAVHGVIDAERRTSSALLDVLGTIDGGEAVRAAVIPGLDYLELRLSPW